MLVHLLPRSMNLGTIKWVITVLEKGINIPLISLMKRRNIKNTGKDMGITITIGRVIRADRYSITGVVTGTKVTIGEDMKIISKVAIGKDMKIISEVTIGKDMKIISEVTIGKDMKIIPAKDVKQYRGCTEENMTKPQATAIVPHSAPKAIVPQTTPAVTSLEQFLC